MNDISILPGGQAISRMLNPNRISFATGSYAILGGVITLIGWAANLPRLTDWLASGISMLPNTAASAVLAGVGLIFLSFGYKRTAACVGLVPGLIGAATVFEHVTGINLGIDTVLLARPWGQHGTYAQGRIGPPASVCLTLIGMAFVLSGFEKEKGRIKVVVAITVIAISVLSITGYIFGADSLYAVPRATTIALPTATILFVLGIGLVASVPDVDPMKTLRSRSAAATLVRRALPFIILLPILIGWLRLQGQHEGLYDAAFGTALRTIVEVALLVALLWWAAAAVDAYEVPLRESEQRYRTLFESMTEGFCIIEVKFDDKQKPVDYRFLETNPAFRKQTGLNDVEGKWIRDLAPTHEQHWFDTYGKVALTGEPARVVNHAAALGRWYEVFAVRFEPVGSHRVGVVFNDITDRKRTEEELRNSEARKDAILKAALDAIVSMDKDGRFVEFNPAAEKLFGYSREEAIGKPLADLIIPHRFRERHSQGLARYMATGEGPVLNRLLELPALRRDGTEFPAELAILPIPGIEPPMFTAFLRDITERKQKEATLRFLVDLGAATQRITEPNEIMATTAKQLAEHLGVDRCAYAEIENENIFVITGDYAPKVPSIVGRWPVAAFGRECSRLMLENKAYVVVDVDTDPRISPEDIPAYRATTIQAVICVPLHKAGKFTAAMAVHQTKPRQWTTDEIELVQLVVGRCWESLVRARTIRSLRTSEERLRFMAESMPQKIFTARPDGHTDYYNPQWIEFTGLTLEQIMGWGWQQFIHPDDLEENVRRWKHAVEVGEYFQIEHRFRRYDGVYRWHLTRAHPMRDAQGDIVMWIGSNTDIEDQKRAEEGLEQTVQSRTAELRETNEQLEAFVYSIAHDLRAPLRSMLGFSQMLIDDYAASLDGVARNYLGRINQSSEFMDKLIMDLLAFGRTSRTELEFETVDVEKAWENAVFQSTTEIEKTKAQVDARLPLPSVRAHSATLTQVLANLLSNALKFVSTGVQPIVHFRAEEEGGVVRLWVEDNGVGIPQEHHERVFRVFERLHGARYAGTGIGLSIVRKGVERMNGKIGLESDSGKGTRFWIELPKG